jgi:hypothetical protein
VKSQQTQILIAAGVVVLSLLTSLVLYVSAPNLLVRRTLFFPERPGVAARGQIAFASEGRRLRVRRGLQPKARQIVEEIILGPAKAGSQPVVPRGTVLHGVVVSRHVAYVNLSAEVLAPADADYPLLPERRVQTVAHTLYHNLPRLRLVYVLISGETPDWSRVNADPSLDFTQGVVDRRPLVR